jgi:hypothetical protein
MEWLMNAVIARRPLSAEAPKAEQARPANAGRAPSYDSPRQEAIAKYVMAKYAPLLKRLAK